MYGLGYGLAKMGEVMSSGLLQGSMYRDQQDFRDQQAQREQSHREISQAAQALGVAMQVAEATGSGEMVPDIYNKYMERFNGSKTGWTPLSQFQLKPDLMSLKMGNETLLIDRNRWPQILEAAQKNPGALGQLAQQGYIRVQTPGGGRGGRGGGGGGGGGGYGKIGSFQDYALRRMQQDGIADWGQVPPQQMAEYLKEYNTAKSYSSGSPGTELAGLKLEATKAYLEGRATPEQQALIGEDKDYLMPAAQMVNNDQRYINSTADERAQAAIQIAETIKAARDGGSQSQPKATGPGIVERAWNALSGGGKTPDWRNY